MKRIFSDLTFQVIIAIILGIVVGIYWPAFAPTAEMISKTFISLITMLIAPIIFFTIVLGIAGMNDMKKVGRVGGKAILYFEVVTTFSLILGVGLANLLKPGIGLVTAGIGHDTTKLATYQKAAAQMHWAEFFTHIVPTNIMDAFSRGDILQILFFAILFR